MTAGLVDTGGEHGCVFIRRHDWWIKIEGSWEWDVFVSVDIGNLDMIVILSLEVVW